MRAMILDQPKQPLVLREVPQPIPGPGQVLVRMDACAVCRTDLQATKSSDASQDSAMVSVDLQLGTA
jgi:propanol-preferring alcohol dehydrogenase